MWYHHVMDNYSGQFRLRIPSSLHQALAEQAKEEGVSLNMFVTSILAGGVAYKAPVELKAWNVILNQRGNWNVFDDDGEPAPKPWRFKSELEAKARVQELMIDAAIGRESNGS